MECGAGELREDSMAARDAVPPPVARSFPSCDGAKSACLFANESRAPTWLIPSLLSGRANPIRSGPPGMAKESISRSSRNMPSGSSFVCSIPRAGAKIERVAMRWQTDLIWHCYLPEARPAWLYGYRVYGPYDPKKGFRFNPHKLLLDPYARAYRGDGEMVRRAVRLPRRQSRAKTYP